MEMGDPLHALNSVDTLISRIFTTQTQGLSRGKPQTKDNFS